MRCLENTASGGTIVTRMELSLLSIKDCAGRCQLLSNYANCFRPTSSLVFG